MLASYPIFVAETMEPSDTDGWRLSFTNPLFAAADGRPAATEGRAIRRPSEFNLYFREQIALLKVAEPSLSHVERMRRVGENWRQWKRAAAGAAGART